MVQIDFSHVPVSPSSHALMPTQCCFDAAKKLRADGMGVQLARKECFTQASRAVFPWNGTPDQWVETAFSTENA